MTRYGQIAHLVDWRGFLSDWRNMRRVVPLGGNEALFIHGLYMRVLVTSWAVEELPVHSVHLVGVDADAYLSAPCSSASHSVGIMSCAPFAGDLTCVANAILSQSAWRMMKARGNK